MYHGISKGEQQTASRLVDRILASHYEVSVFDEETWAISRSTDKAAILDAMGNTSEDILKLHDANGMNQGKGGTILLVWGNAPDGSELVADHSDNDKIRHIVEL